jgi:hypothetical protein
MSTYYETSFSPFSVYLPNLKFSDRSTHQKVIEVTWYNDIAGRDNYFRLPDILMIFWNLSA